MTLHDLESNRKVEENQIVSSSYKMGQSHADL